MTVQKLAFDGFRNLEANKMAANEAVNIIYGDNAQGKTNLIEAVWLFTGSKSFRGSKEDELIGFGKTFARLKLDFFSEGRAQTAEMKFSDKKEIFLNGVSKKMPSDLAGSFHAVVFSPLHIKLVEDGPEIRRRFLDLAIGQIYPKYIDLLKRYSRAAAQRNSALRDVKNQPEIYDLIDIFEHSIAMIGGRMVRYRMKYLKLLEKYAPEIYAGISRGSEKLTFSYFSKCENMSEDEQQNTEILLRALKSGRDSDILKGSTSVGPHRDDMNIEINACPVRNFGSQGQKRSAVLALKLAEAEILKETTGEQPVVLLDDVMSELDTGRQDYILNHIDGWQVFITCCDPASIQKLVSGKVFYMEKGIIRES